MAMYPEALVLVAVLNNPRDFEIARVLGWYRIPLKSAPKVVAVDYLAFYQTSAFEQAKWQIRHVAPVRGVELATRGELLRDEPDHPHASHEYYKIQLGALEALPAPIPAGQWRRITFFYTTGEYLLRARTVNDLIVAEDDRRLLWQALRERLGQVGQYGDPSAPPDELDPAVLAMLLGLHESPAAYTPRNTQVR